MKKMNCVFLRATYDGDNVRNYLHHINELTVVSLTGLSDLNSLVEKLKIMKPKHTASINDWKNLQPDDAFLLSLSDIFGIDAKFASFDFKD
jgi:hypothetical protein